jgi:hypothetical protein
MCRVLLAAVLAAALAAGCGSDGDEAAEPPAPPAPPETGPPPATAEAPSVRAEDLPAAALRPADLPQGFPVRREGFIEPAGDVVAAYRRSFSGGEAPLGQSAVADLTSEVALFADPTAAVEGLGVIGLALFGEQVEAAFADLIRSVVGIEAENVAGQTLAIRGLGDGAVAARAEFDSEAGRAAAVYVVVQVGPLHHALLLVGLPGQIRTEDAVDLAREQVPRLEAALEGQFAA